MSDRAPETPQPLPVHMGPWTPLTQESTEAIACASSDLIAKLLVLEEEDSGLDRFLTQALIPIRGHLREQCLVLKYCFAALMQKKYGPYDAPPRRRALILVKEMQAQGWSFKDPPPDLSFGEKEYILDLFKHAFLKPEIGDPEPLHALSHDLLPEVFKALTAMDFPWHFTINGFPVALYLVEQSAQAKAIRVIAAVKAADLPTYPSPHTYHESLILPILRTHISRQDCFKPPYYVPYSDHMMALVEHLGGCALLATTREMLEKQFVNDKVKVYTRSDRYAFREHLLQHCTLRHEAALLAETLSLNAPESTHTLPRRRV